MNDWVALPRYREHPSYIVTLKCGHSRITGPLRPGMNPDLAVYGCWCDIWFQAPVRVSVIP